MLGKRCYFAGSIIPNHFDFVMISEWSSYALLLLSFMKNSEMFKDKY